MARIYFKPQNSPSRAVRPRKQQQQVGKGLLPLHNKEGLQEEGWRNKLDPQAIEQIADGLEKMMLSWTLPKTEGMRAESPRSDPPFIATANVQDVDTSSELPVPREPIVPQPSWPPTVTEFNIFVSRNNRPVSSTGPTIQEVNPEEIVPNNCRTITSGEPIPDQVSSDSTSRYWYLAPKKALPSCTPPVAEESRNFSVTEKVQEEFRPICEAVTSMQHAPFQLRHHNPFGDRNDAYGGPLQSIDQEKDMDCSSNEQNNVLQEKITYHIKTNGSDNWTETIEINGGDRINELLTKRLASLGNCVPSFPHLEVNGESTESYKKKVEELQIALLECAMEYEVKIVEMKMKMLRTKSDCKQKGVDKLGTPKSGEEMDVTHINSQQERTDAHRVEYLRKQLCKMQREKLALSKELNDLRKRERQFDLQRRSLDDALNRVNSLQRELNKRDQEIVDCQLREKEVKAQLYEVQMALQKAQASQIEPRKLLTLLPALREWLQAMKKGQHFEPAFLEPQPEKTIHSPPVDNIVCSVTKEIHALQKALSRLAARK